MSAENQERLAKFITARRIQLGMTGTAQLAQASGIGKRTIDGWLSGETEPQAANQYKLEQALQWRRGAIAALLTADYPEAVSLEDMAEPQEQPKATRASELTDDELLVEVMHRLRDWRDRPAPGSWAPEEAPRELFGLAAHDDEGWRGEGAGAPE